MVFVEALPRNPAGKVLIAELRDRAARGGGGAVMAEAAQVFGVGVETLRLSSTPENTKGWDSFAHLAMITALEARFSVTLSAQEVFRITTLGSVIDILRRKGAAAEAPSA